MQDDDEVEAADTDDEPFVRYQNSMYRVISLVGAGVVLVLGITGLAIGFTLDPSPPPSFFWMDVIVTVVLLVWYLLGMRCRLDLSATRVHVATKYGDFRAGRDVVDGIEADMSIRGSLQLSGRPLIVHYTDGDRARRRRAYGCLPADNQGQAAALAQLQAELGSPENARSAKLDAALGERLATMEPEGDDHAADL